MQKGKDICKALKEVRQQIADANNIRYQPCECHHKGDCSGTCPACEQEIRYLEEQLIIRKRRGWSMKVAGLAAGFCVATIPLVSCNNTPKSTFAKAIESPQTGEVLQKVENFSTDKEHSVVIKIQLIASDNKRPVTSVDVRLLGTDKHTSTGLDGYFAVKVPINGTLRVSGFGVETKVLKVRSLLKLKKKIIELEMDRYIFGEVAAPSSERISDSDSPMSHVEKNK